MARYLKQALIFGIYGLACGVFFREFTKFNGFNGRTMLGMAHPHILALGLAGFLLIAIFVHLLKIEVKRTNIANLLYIIGLVIASIMMLVRGVMEVTGAEISTAMNGAISGIAGIGHVLTAVGLVWFLILFIKAAKASEEKN